jgi:hypothetical protein
MSHSNFRAKRFGLIAVLAVTLLCLANYLLSWNLFGEKSGVVLGLAVATLFLYVHFVGPTPREMQEYWSAKKPDPKG